MKYKEVEFEKRKPKWSANTYFYMVHSGGFLYKYDSGYTGHMEHHLRENPKHIITWLEPESQWEDS